MVQLDSWWKRRSKLLLLDFLFYRYQQTHQKKKRTEDLEAEAETGETEGMEAVEETGETEAAQEEEEMPSSAPLFQNYSSSSRLRLGLESAGRKAREAGADREALAEAEE